MAGRPFQSHLPHRKTPGTVFGGGYTLTLLPLATVSSRRRWRPAKPLLTSPPLLRPDDRVDELQEVSAQPVRLLSANLLPEVLAVEASELLDLVLGNVHW